ncbi:MAG: helix-turn-helix transcriptional regulator [Solirubrobacteraceae bacterium]
MTALDVPLLAGDVLAQPTRARVFALLGALHRPAGTEEVARALDLHPNGVRIHLERLLAAGLVERRREHMVRGRPRDTWTISPNATPGGAAPTAYTALARWLVRALVVSGAHVREMEVTGQQIGHGLAAERQGLRANELTLFDWLTAMGFQPVREPSTGTQATYRLRNCPYRVAVHEQARLVCALHRGLTNGWLQAIDPHNALAGFDAKTPGQAGCLISIRGPIAARDVATTPRAVA